VRRVRYSRAFWALCIGRLSNQVGAFTLTFLTLLMTQRGHLSVPQAGMVMAAFSLATFPSRILGGRLADSWSQRGSVVLGLLLTSAGQLALFAASSTLVLVCAAILLGLAFEIYEPGTAALVQRSTTLENRSEGYSVLSVFIQIGSVMTGLLAVVLIGSGIRWLFLADACSSLAGAGIIALMGGPVQSGAARRRPARRVKPRLADSRLFTLTLLACLYASCYLAVTSVLPLTMTSLHVAPQGIGIVLTVSSIISIVLVPLMLRALKGRSDRKVLSWAYVVMGLGFVLTGFSRSLPEFVGSAVLWGTGEILALGCAQAIVSMGIDPENMASGMAFYGLSWSVGGIVAPLAGTLLLAHAGPRWTWAAFGLTLAVLGPLTSLLARRVPARHSTGAEPDEADRSVTA
jgi:MFS family permease